MTRRQSLGASAAQQALAGLPAHDAADAPITVTVSGATARTGIPRTAIYDLVAAGRLRISRVGRRSLIVYADLHRVVLEGVVARDAEVRGASRNGRMIRAAQSQIGDAS
jgi:excisionase family DNA binding protein